MSGITVNSKICKYVTGVAKFALSVGWGKTGGEALDSLDGQLA